MQESGNTAGLYIHIPFCQQKCRYCDFYSTTDLNRAPDFLEGLKKEMALCKEPGTRVDTLYIGGGTPSLLTPKQVGKIVDWAAAGFDLDPSAEMTLEVNPATATKRDLQDYAAFGFNRLNIGVQSFNDQQLSFLGRLHSGQQAMAAVQAAIDAGFKNIGLDLIYALPNQTPSMWKKDLMQAMRLAPKHLSCYMLTYEPHTPLYNDQQSGRTVPLKEQLSADLFRMTHDFLGVAGYEHYEISNFARGSRWRSKHNQKYWNFVPYFGIGPSAHGFSWPKRWWNHRSLSRYLEDLNQDKVPRSDQEELNNEQLIIEALYLGLRQSDGLDLSWFQQLFHIDFKLYFHTALERFDAQQWIEMDARRCRLTLEGMLFLDRIVDELIENLE
jgi:putative oxygen-independent coproporphyrinogen III oxidase